MKMNKNFKKIIFILLFIFSSNLNVNSEEKKIKIGLLVPMTGNEKNLGELIIKATRMALKDIGNNNIEIYPKDTSSDPNKTRCRLFLFSGQKTISLNQVNCPRRCESGLNKAMRMWQKYASITS